MLRLIASSLLAAAVTLVAGPARAFDGLESARALGMANALRASPNGAPGLTLNPSGMSLQKAYQIEADYAYGPQLNSHGLLLAFVDSTSGTRLAGGISYQFLNRNPLDFRTRQPLQFRGHDLAIGLSYPLGEFVSVGASGKYQRLTLSAGARNDRRTGYDEHHGNLDAAITFTLAPFRLAVVGQNVIDAHDPSVPVALAIGASFGGIRDDPFLVGIDTTVDFTTWGRATARYAVGGEYTIKKIFAVRTGYILDTGGGVRHYASTGISLTAARASFDLGYRQQANLEKESQLAVGIRILVQ